jgi:gas vesicle protein
MIDGAQLLSLFVICFYIGVGVVVGFIAGLILIPSYCVLHPFVKSLWEQHRVMVEARKGINESMKIIKKKMRETQLDAMKEVLKRHYPPVEEDINGADTTNQRSR